MRIANATAQRVRPLDRPVSRPVALRPDGFVGGAAKAVAHSQQTVAFAGAVKSAFAQTLGREPTAEELQRFDAFAKSLTDQGKGPADIDAAFRWVICSGPEWQARSVAQAELGRLPTADELQKTIAWGQQLAAQGKSPGEVHDAFTFVTRMGPEWQARSVAQEELGRLPTADELQKATAWGQQLQAQGKSTGEMRDAFTFVTRMGPEWQARSVSQAELGRLPTADELKKTTAWGQQLAAQGKSPGEIRDAFTFVTRMGPEWQARSSYQTMLGREPTADELQKMTAWGQQLQAEGKATPEMRGAFDFVIALSPEYQTAHTPDRVRAQVAQWAITQANDPNVGYSQTAGRFGNRVDSQGHRYFDCSGLVTAAYAQAGINLPANWTGAMQQSWPQWADQIPKDTNAMKPGDLILMDGHVVMYIGGGKCVGAQTSHGAFADQVRADIDANHYLARPDAIVIRPHV